MTPTRAHAPENVFKHIVDNILRSSDELDPIHQCLHQNDIKELPDLMVMTEANIQQWEYRYHGTENTDSPAIQKNHCKTAHE